MIKPKVLDWNILNFNKQEACKSIQNNIIEHIISGALPAGTVLPSTRLLREELEVSRHVLLKALRELAEQGWLLSRTNKLYKVAANYPNKMPAPLLITHPFAARLIQARPGLNPTDTPFVNIAKDFMKSANTPFVSYMKALEKHIKAAARNTQINNLEAYKGLTFRNAVCNYLMSKHRLTINQQQIAVLHKREACLSSIFTVLLRPGEVVVNTSFNDYVLANALITAGVTVIFLDSTAPDFLKQLEELLKSENIKALYLRPQCNFVHGYTLSAADAEGVIAFSNVYNFAIIEEEDDHEFWYGDEPYMPLVGHAEQNNVIHIAALSKASNYLQAIRVVIAAENFIKALSAVPCYSIECRNIAAEQTVIDMMASGKLLDTMRQFNVTAAQNGKDLAFMVQNYLGSYCSTVMPRAGLSLWIKFREDIDILKVIHEMELTGFNIPFHPVQPYLGPSRFLRYGFGDFDGDEAQAFIKGMLSVIKVRYS